MLILRLPTWAKITRMDQRVSVWGERCMPKR